MIRDNRDYVNDILESINDILEFTQNIGYEEFYKDKKTINAVIRSFEIIGEGAKNITIDLKEKFNNISWKYMAGMRDKLIHQYFGVDIEIIWTTIKEDLIPLKTEMEKIKKFLE